MGDATIVPKDPPKGVTFEDAWAAIQEAARQIKETGQQMKELSVEADRRMKKTDRQIGRLSNRLGEMVEHLMSPKLHQKFNTLGFTFTQNSRVLVIRDRDQKYLTEIDVFLENGEYALAVEVKTHPSIEDVQQHLERMEILRRVAGERNDKRSYLGAIAGAVFRDEVQDYALKNGLYVIIPSGETVEIAVPGARGPRIWRAGAGGG